MKSGRSTGNRIELGPGEEMTATIISMRETETKHGAGCELIIQTEERGTGKYYGEDNVKTQFKAGNLNEGETYWIAKMSETENIDDDTEYYPVKIMELDE